VADRVKKSSKLRVLITGGSGYLAPIIGQALAESRHKVVFATRSIGSQQQPIADADEILINWGDDKTISAACFGVETVVHAAGLGAHASEKSPEEANSVNAVNTEKIVRTAKASGVSLFVYLSTAHVYNDSLSGVFTESSPTLNLHPYASTHALGEQLALKFGSSNFKVIVLRLANVFGAPVGHFGNAADLVMHDFALQAVTNGKIIIQSSSSITRDFVPSSYLARLVRNVVQSQDLASIPNVLNVGWGEPKSLIEAAKIIASKVAGVTGIRPEILELSTGETAERFTLSSDLATRLCPKMPGEFDDEVKRLVEYVLKGAADE
jgi:UDP-glucose 4-epimerase